MAKEQTTIRLPAELVEQLKQEADKRDMSFNSLINLMLSNQLKNISQLV